MENVLNYFPGIFYNHPEGRLRSFWRLLIGFLLGFLSLGALKTLARYLLAFFLALAAQIPFSALGNARQLAEQIDTVYHQVPLIAGLYSLIILAGVVLAFLLVARWIDRRPWRDYGFHFSTAWWRDLVFGLLLGALLIAVVFGVEALLGWESIRGVIENDRPDFPFWQLLMNSLIAYLLVGVQEELFFRGFAIKNLAEGLHRARLNSRVSVVLPYLLISLFFGFAHGSNPNATLVSSLNLSLIGLLLGLGFILTGELAISIGLHIAWNFTLGHVFGFPVSGSDAGLSLLATQQSGPVVWTGGAFGPEGGLIGLGAALLGMLLIYAWVRWTRRLPAVQTGLAQYSPAPVPAAGN
jgi:membrane protease YdiL (CAAX protease family)